MGLDDFIPEIESSEGTGNSAEASKESSEKYKESQKKAGVKVQKVAKDEKKAKKYDFLLAGFLVKIIVDKKYDSILENLFPAIHTGYPSNFVLGILSLINIEISTKIREVSKKDQITFKYNIKSETEEFDDNHIDTDIRNRINHWVEDITDSVTIEYSDIQTEKLLSLLNSDDKILISYTKKVFTFFLKELNITISESKAENISHFILSEVKKEIENIDVESL